jgi:hypothetical protein
VPSVLRDEIEYNAFMKCRDPKIIQILGVNDAESCMHYLREWKNLGKKHKL